MKRSKFITILTAALCVCAVGSCDFLEGLIPADTPQDEQPDDKPDPDAIDWSDPDWYSTNFWERTDRQKAGLRGPVKKWHIGNYTTYDEYEYDVAGHLIREAYVDTEKPEYNHEWHYTYDSAGHRTKKEYVCSDLDYSVYTIYEYENTGKFVATDYFMMGPEISDAENGIRKDLSRTLEVSEDPYSKSCLEAVYTFGADGNLRVRESSYTLYPGSDEKDSELSFEYTVVYENGYPKSLDDVHLSFNVVNITYYPNGMYKDFEFLNNNSYNYETGKDRHTYRMLDNPRYMAVESFALGGMASYISLTPKWMRKIYDEHYDIVRNEESFGSDDYVEGAEPTYVDTWEDYTYDKYGNWTTRLETIIPRYTGEAYPSTIRREIEYFD